MKTGIAAVGVVLLAFASAFAADKDAEAYKKEIERALATKPASVNVKVQDLGEGFEVVAVAIRYDEAKSFGYKDLSFQANRSFVNGKLHGTAITVRRADGDREERVLRMRVDDKGTVIEQQTFDWTNKEKVSGVEKRCKEILEGLDKAVDK
jgi:hypothetical protein